MAFVPQDVMRNKLNIARKDFIIIMLFSLYKYPIRYV